MNLFKLDNRGFAVSSVLYTLLIAFLLFLGAALAEFSSSTKILSKANEDLVAGSRFAAEQINKCIGGSTTWYSNDVVKITYGSKSYFFPKDFTNTDGTPSEFYKNVMESKTINTSAADNKDINDNRNYKAISNDGKIMVAVYANTDDYSKKPLKLSIKEVKNKTLIQENGYSSVTYDNQYYYLQLYNCAAIKNDNNE